MRPRLPILLGSALLLLAARPASADDNAAAEALFQQAKTLVEAKRWADACPKFAASYKLDGTLGTLLNLADCEEHVDKLASAWAHFGEALEIAQAKGDKRADYASARRAKLTPRLSYVQLDVTVGKSTLAVRRDGIRVDPAAFGVPLPSDPGAHKLEVLRGAEVLTTREVTLAERQTERVTFDLEAIERAAPPPRGGASPQRTAGFALLGVGAATVVIAAGLEVGAMVAKGKANEPSGCVPNSHFCTPLGLDSVERARTLANAGQWVGIGGILVAAVGVTLAATAKANAPRSASIAPWIGPGLGGVSVGGAW